jgi:hypothetical protein
MLSPLLGRRRKPNYVVDDLSALYAECPFTVEIVRFGTETGIR